MNIENIERAGEISQKLKRIAQAMKVVSSITDHPDPSIFELCSTYSDQSIDLSGLLSRHEFRALIETELDELKSNLLEEAKSL